jgi:hypothetical protein
MSQVAVATPTTADMPDDGVMRHMFAGRLISQHVMLFEPVVYAAHLRALSGLVGRSVLTPAAASGYAGYRPAAVSLVRMCERDEVPDGGWPEFVQQTRVVELALADRRHEVVVAAGAEDRLPALRQAAAVLDDHGLGALVELTVGGLVAAADHRPIADIRDSLLLAPAGGIDLAGADVDAVLLEILLAVPRLWGAPEPAARARLAEVLAPVTPEEVFSAGCALDLAERAAARGTDLPAHLPVLFEWVERVRDRLSAEAHRYASELKASSLLAEMLLCWWPDQPRTVHLFTSQLDYLTRHPEADPVGARTAGGTNAR